MPSLKVRSYVASAVLACTVAPGWAATEQEEPPKLLGAVTVGQLSQEPFAEWFRKGYDEYVPHPETLAGLRGADSRDVGITVFFGTWCGDSRRDVPRLLKLLDTLDFPADKLELIALDTVDEAHKRSPGGEEQGHEIYRVPTVLVRRGGIEIARIVEHAVLSLERDLLAILDGRPYEPNYTTYPVVRAWLRDGLLADPNVSPHGLANLVRHQVTGEGELAAPARVLLHRGDATEAVKLLRVNCVLYRESPGCFTRLADGLLRSGDRQGAGEAAATALRLGPDAEGVKSLVELIGKTAE